MTNNQKFFLDVLEKLGSLKDADPMTSNFYLELLTNTQLFDKKHKSYGLKNVQKLKVEGLLLRCEEKIERIKNMLARIDKFEEETIEDSLRDISNLATIALLYRKGIWPKS